MVEKSEKTNQVDKNPETTMTQKVKVRIANHDDTVANSNLNLSSENLSVKQNIMQMSKVEKNIETSNESVNNQEIKSQKNIETQKDINKKNVSRLFIFSRTLMFYAVILLVISLSLLGYKIWYRTIGFPKYLELNNPINLIDDPIERNLASRKVFYDEHTTYEIESIKIVSESTADLNKSELEDNDNIEPNSESDKNSKLSVSQNKSDENNTVLESESQSKYKTQYNSGENYQTESDIKSKDNLQVGSELENNENLELNNVAQINSKIGEDNRFSYYAFAPIQVRNANRYITLSDFKSPDLSQYSAVSILAINLDTDEILFSKDPDKIWPIASLTKMMSALVILDSWDPQDEIIASGDDYIQIERHVGLQNGDRFSVEEGLQMMIMYSYNDVPVAFARAYEGGYPAFVNAMNQKAIELGMNNTHFEVVEGLSGDNTSTANDLMILTREFLENDLCREISSTKNKSVSLIDGAGNVRDVDFANTNQLIFSVPENVGIKTGFLYVSGENFISLFNYDNLGAKNDLVIIVLGSSDRFGETNSLFQVIKNY